MGNPQESYIKRLKGEGKKLLNSWVDETTILSLKKLKKHYQVSNRGVLIETIIHKHLEFIKTETKTSNTSNSRIDMLEERVLFLEEKVLNQTPVKVSKSISLSPDGNYNKEKIHNRIIELKNQNKTSNEISVILNNEGFTTLQGEMFDFYQVQKQIIKIWKNGVEI